jgi:flagellar biosynthesis protein FlhB
MSEKRHPPSPQRLSRARRDGKVVKSRIVTMAAGWIGLSIFLTATHPWVRIGTLIQWFKFKVLSPGATLKHALLITGALLVVSIGSVALGTVLASLLQTRGIVATKQIIPQLTRVQPAGYLRRVREGALDVVGGVFRIATLIAVVLPLVVLYVWHAPELLRAPGDVVVPAIQSFLLSAWSRGMGVMVVLAGCAYGLVWRRFMKEHRMSFEEVKEEFKESEGDPHLRAARKHEHQALAMAEIEKRVRNSKVLVIRRRVSSER